MTDWAGLYREHVDAVAVLAVGLDDDQQRSTVPGTPAWTVHDVYAHLAGGAADRAVGRTRGAPGPEWTAHHVAERAGLGLADLVGELRSHAAALGPLDDAGSGPVWDVAVHHADLREGLGLDPLPEHLWAPVLEVVRPWAVRGLPPGELASYEVFRAVFSRRSRAQLRSWPGLAEADVDAVGVFGPRDDDQPVPVRG